MNVLTLQQERLAKTLVALEVTELEQAKVFVTEAGEKHFSKMESLVDAYNGLADRFFDLLPEGSDDNPNDFPEMEVMRNVIKAVFNGFNKRSV